MIQRRLRLVCWGGPYFCSSLQVDISERPFYTARISFIFINLYGKYCCLCQTSKNIFVLQPFVRVCHKKHPHTVPSKCHTEEYQQSWPCRKSLQKASIYCIQTGNSQEEQNLFFLAQTWVHQHSSWHIIHTIKPDCITVCRWFMASTEKQLRHLFGKRQLAFYSALCT